MDGRNSMKAWRALAGGALELLDLPVPEPGPGDVVIRMQGVPLHGSLRRVIEGSIGCGLPSRPFTPGIGGIGMIESIGARVFDLQPGMRVVLDPHALMNGRRRDRADMRNDTHANVDDLIDAALHKAWPEGTCAECTRMPASAVTPLPLTLHVAPADRLVAIAKLAVPYGGFLRARLEGGETVVVNGASGYYGSAAVVLAAALGAARIVAAGRSRTVLSDLADRVGPQVFPVTVSGEVGADAEALRDAAGGGADFALDIANTAKEADSTLAALRSLRRGGRLVLMGNAERPLPLTVPELRANEWHVMGCRTYPSDVPARAARLIAEGRLDLGHFRVRSFPLADLVAAMNTAEKMRGLDITALTME